MKHWIKWIFVLVIAFWLSLAVVEFLEPIRDSRPQTRVPDFENFTFPATNEWESFRLVDGESPYWRSSDGKQDKMGYSLVTRFLGTIGSCQECAVAIVSVQTGGSAVPLLAYVFDVQSENPRLIWSMAGGDRADGGLKNMFIEKSQLVVETYEDTDSNGDCCPKTYKSSIYTFDDNEIKLVDEKEGLSNPLQDARWVGYTRSFVGATPKN